MAEKPYTTTTPPPPPATSKENIQLETNKAERHVWLMKCPLVVTRAMNHHHHHNNNNNSPLSTSGASSLTGQNVAKVIVAVDPLRPNEDFSSTEFTMELTDSAGNIPKSYRMNMSEDVIPMSVFSESSQGKFAVEGKIYHKFDMKPHTENTEEYARICRERNNKYNTKTRQTQIINDDRGMRMRPMPGMLDIKAPVTSEKKKMATKGLENKRTRRDPAEMEKIMFKLFERQPNWTLKQLVQETDQPEQFLKDMLKLLCIYNNKGTNQGSYELKTEYKT